jgi:hypothetical protein
MRFNLKAIFLSLLLVVSFAFNASADSTKLSQELTAFASNQTEVVEKDVLQNALKFQGFGATQVIPSNMSCGFPPFPPLGCKNPQCICEVQNGRQTCRWIFECRSSC